MNDRVSELARRTQFQATTQMLGTDPTDEQILALADGAQRFTIQLVETIAAGALEPLACSAGCDSCCYLMATVSAPEALAIAQHLEVSWSPEAVADLKLRIEADYQQTGDMDNIARIQAAIPCPFLGQAGLCTIYPYRPLDCVTHHSLSRAACEELLADPGRERPTNGAIRAAGMGIKAGLGHGLVEAGLERPALRYELIEAMHICLNGSGVMGKYVAGKNPFMPAAIIGDGTSGITYKLKTAPPHLRDEARRVFAQERRQGGASAGTEG